MIGIPGSVNRVYFGFAFSDKVVNSFNIVWGN